MKYTNQMVEGYLTDKIDNSWYRNAKIDFGVNGKVEKVNYNNEVVTVYFKEDGKRFVWSFGHYSDYTPEQLYNIWQEQDWKEI